MIAPKQASNKQKAWHPREHHSQNHGLNCGHLRSSYVGLAVTRRCQHGSPDSPGLSEVFDLLSSKLEMFGELLKMLISENLHESD